ncbi:MAG TPA: Phenylacetic acid catabolic protein, partial [Chloroflexota bacterium]|nr:Phenylacetic acid catabolic protein [Chloroflexota bacterium]
EDRGLFHSMASLDQPFGSWIDFVSTNFFVDTALTTLYVSAADSSYDDLRNRARRIVGEEGIHWLHGKGWVRRLARDSVGTKQALSDALCRQAHEVLMWFGEPESPEVNDLVARKVLGTPPDGMRRRFRDRVAPVLELTDIAVDVISDACSALPWQRWDGERYRIRGE